MTDGSKPDTAAFPDVVASVSGALEAHGLLVRGGFNVDAADDAPRGIKTVLVIGNAGAAYWPHFQGWRDTQPPGLADPLDRWCRAVIGGVASNFGARAVSPSDRPFLPFQRWAMRAEGLRASPLGILMHPRYGLWHAYRGALLFDLHVPIPEPRKPIHLCDACIGKPCLKACPVDAHSETGFDYRKCLEFAGGPRGVACRGRGCLDRNACPHGGAYRYPPDVQAFHMSSFLSPAPQPVNS